MQQAEIIRAVHILQREGWDADKILAFILEVFGDVPDGGPADKGSAPQRGEEPSA